MKANKILWILFIAITFGGKSNAQQSPEEISKQFFDKYKNEGSDKAMDFLFKTNKYTDEFKESFDELKSKLKTTLSTIGPFTGYEFLAKKKSGESIVMLTFIAKHQKAPLTFRIVYYRPENAWQVQNCRFNGNMEDELEEASRAYRFKDNLDE